MSMSDIYFVFCSPDVNIESPPSMYPSKKYCDITGFEVKSFLRAVSFMRHTLRAIHFLLNYSTCLDQILVFHMQAPYADPRTNLRYVSPDVFKRIRMLPNEYVQRYLTLRNAAVVLK